MQEGRVLSAEWVRVRQDGTPPIGRVDHTMEFLPTLQALIVIGGRNDKKGASLDLETPFLGDIFLFLFDQMAWINIKYTSLTHRFERMSNHCMGVMNMSGGQDRILMFGGVTSRRDKTGKNVFSLCSQMYQMEIKTKQ
mmetsp:Transcript_37701/g.36162  ORF Transcript_37701/g.36162 Transcript_37701/m.36162 type:complete len:138 (-) Transcript_37701:34-447(-)